MHLSVKLGSVKSIYLTAYSNSKPLELVNLPVQKARLINTETLTGTPVQQVYLTPVQLLNVPLPGFKV